MGVTVQQGYTAASSSGSMTLLGTLTTTSGTTQSLTSIPASYRQLYCEFDGVVFAGTTSALNVAASSTNGAAYGSAEQCASTKTAAGDAHGGALIINNIQSSIANSKSFISGIANGRTRTADTIMNYLRTNTAAPLNAIQFSTGGNAFSAGTIRIYGVS